MKDKLKGLNKYLVPLNLKFSTYLPRSSVRFANKYFCDNEVIVIEVGVLNGENAKSMLKTLKIKKIYLIDIEKKFEVMGDGVEFIEMPSDKAYKLIKEKADFIYIDGDHSYEQVIKDINNYYPLLKEGGILAGHDIIGEKGVLKAVIEFCSKNNYNPTIDIDDWWLIKGDKDERD